ncbi:hypothetical protein [Gracilimonas sp.]|nr:hypothetical protein [Gracilimonas sp.]
MLLEPADQVCMYSTWNVRNNNNWKQEPAFVGRQAFNYALPSGAW